jgi:hypothetical protein
MRVYLNFEPEQIRTLLELLIEISLSRGLTRSERYIHSSLLDALRRSTQGI